MISSPNQIQNLKRIVCKFWKMNTCLKGINCPFLHLISEKEICPYYILGFCEKGKLCKKIHYRIDSSIESLSSNFPDCELPEWYLNWSINYFGLSRRQYLGLNIEEAKTLFDNKCYKSSFFLIKCNNQSILNLSKNYKIWSTSNENILSLVKTYLHSDHVFILFYSKPEKAFSGYALMSSLPDNFMNSIVKKFLSEGTEYHFELFWIKEKYAKNNCEGMKFIDIDKLKDFEELSTDISCQLIKTLDSMDEIDSGRETSSVNSNNIGIENDMIQKYLKIYCQSKEVYRKVERSSKYSLKKIKEYWKEFKNM